MPVSEFLSILKMFFYKQIGISWPMKSFIYVLHIIERFGFIDTLNKESLHEIQALNWGTQFLLRLANAKLETKHFNVLNLLYFPLKRNFTAYLPRYVSPL